MNDGFTIYAFSLGAGSALVFEATESDAFRAAEIHLAELRSEGQIEPPARTPIYKVTLSPISRQIIINILNDEHEILPRLIREKVAIGFAK